MRLTSELVRLIIFCKTWKVAFLLLRATVRRLAPTRCPIEDQHSASDPVPGKASITMVKEKALDQSVVVVVKVNANVRWSMLWCSFR
jgi:hypothetical protein